MRIGQIRVAYGAGKSDMQRAVAKAVASALRDGGPTHARAAITHAVTTSVLSAGRRQRGGT